MKALALESLGQEDCGQATIGMSMCNSAGGGCILDMTADRVFELRAKQEFF